MGHVQALVTWATLVRSLRQLEEFRHSLLILVLSPGPSIPPCDSDTVGMVLIWRPGRRASIIPRTPGGGVTSTMRQRARQHLSVSVPMVWLVAQVSTPILRFSFRPSFS